MWIERLGGTDENVFIGFCVVVGVILILTLVNFILEFFAGDSPGHAVSFIFDASVVMICASILFRGVQTKWTSNLSVYRIICQVHTAVVFVGYTLFTSVLCTKSWAYISTFLVKRRCPKWSVLSCVSLLIVICGAAVIVWEVVFTPKVIENTELTEENPYNQTVLECVDDRSEWYRHNSTDYHQFWWRVSASVYIGLITLADLIATPILLCIKLQPRFEWLQAKYRALCMVQVNCFLCLLSGLLIWFVYGPTVLVPQRDNRLYIIIGCLQLWKLFYAQVAFMVARAMSIEPSPCCTCKCVDYSSKYDSTNRLLTTREMATLDRENRDSLSVGNLDIYAPRGPPPSGAPAPGPNQVGYMNLPGDRASNGTNTRQFRY